MKKKLLVLGAGNDQVFMIRTAKSMGLHVIAVDQNPEAPGLTLADESAVVSTRDLSALFSFTDQYRATQGALDGVSTMGSDIPHIVAAVAARLGTPGLPVETARLAVHKARMKQRFRDQGIPTPWFQQVEEMSDFLQIVRERGLPLVIKPVDRSGSRGVFLLTQEEGLETYFRKALDFSFEKRVLVEEFLSGPQISTETIMYGGKGVTPGFADRNYDLLPRFLPQIMENGGWVPSHLSQEQRRQVEKLVERASLALGITDGVTKGDVVWTEQGPSVIEMAARLSGGDFCESLVPLSSGVNYVTAVIRLAIGEDPGIDGLKAAHRQAVVNRYFFAPPGRILAIEGIDEVGKLEWVHKCELWYGVGDCAPATLSHAHRLGVFVLVAPTRREADRRAEEVYRRVRIVTEGSQVPLVNGDHSETIRSA